MRYSVDNDQLPHALLISGPSGIGKMTLARALAQYIHCTNRVNGDSCGKCPSCRQHQSLNNPDMHYVYPIVKKSSPKLTVSEDYLSEWIEFVEEDDSFIIFVTEGELLALQGFTGVKISNAKKYELTFAQIPTVTEWNGKTVSTKLADALAANEGKDVLFAVTAEPAAFSEMLDRSNYEARYLELFSELAKRPAYRKALEAVSADASKLEAAIAICGEGIVADYLWDGYFDAARFDKDTVEMSATVELMRSNLYRDASEVYAEFAPYVRYIEINENGVVVFYVTAEELAAIIQDFS